MNRTLAIGLIFACATISFVPAVSATVCTGIVCNEYVIPSDEQVQRNADGSTTVTYQMCNLNGWCQDRQTTIPSTCFTYNPSALTNGCIVIGTQPVSAPVGYGGLVNVPVCVIGTECVNVPEPVITSGPTTENVPVPQGYVELTAICGTTCHVTL